MECEVLRVQRIDHRDVVFITSRRIVTSRTKPANALIALGDKVRAIYAASCGDQHRVKELQRFFCASMGFLMHVY